MTSLFSHDDAVGVSLSAAQNEIEEAAVLCRFARAMIGGEVSEEEIVDELIARDIEVSAEHIGLVRAAIDRQDDVQDEFALQQEALWGAGRPPQRTMQRWAKGQSGGDVAHPPTFTE